MLLFVGKEDIYQFFKYPLWGEGCMGFVVWLLCFLVMVWAARATVLGETGVFRGCDLGVIRG